VKLQALGIGIALYKGSGTRRYVAATINTILKIFIGENEEDLKENELSELCS
jgi:hypothetical protein